VPIGYRVSGGGVPVVLVHGYTVTSTANFASHYRDAGAGRLVLAPGPTIESAPVGYSMGAWICCHLLGDPWVSKAALCGADSFLLEGEWPEFGESMAALSRCFLQGSWDDHPDFAIHRDWASLDSCGPTSPLSAWSPPPPARFPARW